MSASDHDSAGASLAPVSAHFVNNVLAVAASYIEDDPDRAREVLAELGQFLSYRLREQPDRVDVADELAHTAAYLRLEQARFPDRLALELPPVTALATIGPVIPLAIQRPVSEALDRRLRELPGPCSVVLRPAPAGIVLELRGGEAPPQRLDITLMEGVPA